MIKKCHEVTPHTRTIEMYSINHLDYCIGKEQILESKIPRGDTDPSWDGEIHIYKDISHNAVKQGVIRIPVQVKGKFQPENIKKHRIMYPVRYGDLRNYASERGCVYFVIAVSNEEFEYAIFYNILTPVKVNSYLKGNEDKEGDKTISLPMNKLNHKKQGELLKVLLQYDSDWKKQISVKPTQITDNTITEINCSAIGVTSIQEFLKKFNEGDLCFYTKTGDDIEVPIEWDANGKLFQTEIVEGSVVVDNKIYYERYLVSNDENGIDSIKLSPNVTINFRKNKLDFKINSNLQTLKQDADFMRKLFEKECEIVFSGYKKCKFAYKITPQFKEQLDFIDLLYSLFSNIGATLNIPYTKLSKEDIEQINLLLNIYKRKKDELFKNSTSAYKFFVNNYYIILLICIDEITNELHFVNLFNKSEYITYADLDDGTRCRLPIFGLSDIDSEIFSKLYDDNYDCIIEEFSKMEFTENAFNPLNSILLRLINAYDISNQREKIRDTVEKIAKLMVEKYPNNDVAMVNYLQVKKRKADLSKEEKKLLSTIRANTKYNFMTCGINILLENNYEVAENYSQMSEVQKEEFRKFPIAKLYKGKWE